MEKFKVGDTVKVVSGRYGITVPGSIGIIRGVYRKEVTVNFTYIPNAEPCQLHDYNIGSYDLELVDSDIKDGNYIF